MSSLSLSHPSLSPLLYAGYYLRAKSLHHTAAFRADACLWKSRASASVSRLGCIGYAICFIQCCPTSIELMFTRIVCGLFNGIFILPIWWGNGILFRHWGLSDCYVKCVLLDFFPLYNQGSWLLLFLKYLQVPEWPCNLSNMPVMTF